MDSRIASLARNERGRLQVRTVDAEANRELVERLAVDEQIPTLILIEDGRPSIASSVRQPAGRSSS